MIKKSFESKFQLYIFSMTLLSVLTSNFSYIVDLLAKAIFPVIISSIIFLFAHQHLFKMYTSLSNLKREKLSDGLLYSSIVGAILIVLTSAFNFYNAKTNYTLIDSSWALTFAFSVMLAIYTICITILSTLDIKKNPKVSKFKIVMGAISFYIVNFVIAFILFFVLTFTTF